MTLHLPPTSTSRTQRRSCASGSGGNGWGGGDLEGAEAGSEVGHAPVSKVGVLEEVGSVSRALEATPEERRRVEGGPVDHSRRVHPAGQVWDLGR